MDSLIAKLSVMVARPGNQYNCMTEYSLAWPDRLKKNRKSGLATQGYMQPYTFIVACGVIVMDVSPAGYCVSFTTKGACFPAHI